MSDKYLIQIQPNMSPEDAKKLEDELNKRFNNVSKKFEFNLRKAIESSFRSLATAGIGALTGVVATVITNPFEKINEDLNATLDRFDNTVVRGAEFGVSGGKYFQAETVAKSLGVEDFSMILARYNSKLDAARIKTPGVKPEDDYLKNFIQDKDILASFSAFAETLRLMKPEQRNFAVEQVFGTKLGLRLAELFQTDVGNRRQQIYGNQTSKQLNAPIQHISDMEDIQKLNRARLDVSSMLEKSKIINKGIIAAQNEVEKANLAKDITQLSQYQNFAKLAEVQAEMSATLNGIRNDITAGITPYLKKFVGDFNIVKDWAVGKFGKKEKGVFK